MKKVSQYELIYPSSNNVKVVKKGRAYDILEDIRFDSIVETLDYEKEIELTKNIIKYNNFTDELYGAFSLQTGKFLQFYSVFQKAFVGEVDDNGELNLNKTIDSCIDKLRELTISSKDLGITNLKKKKKVYKDKQ